jgi:hypothetical protein
MQSYSAKQPVWQCNSSKPSVSLSDHRQWSISSLTLCAFIGMDSKEQHGHSLEYSSRHSCRCCQRRGFGNGRAGHVELTD